jgi:uncharacterized protein YbjT (DUF2867 family)
MMRAIIFGATGLTGSALLRLTASGNIYDEIICFQRREVEQQFAKQRNIITTFHDLHYYADLFIGSDVFCCLGTTMRQVQNDKVAYREADLERPLAAAKAAASHGAKSFSIQTALTANPKSLIFYNRIKGEIEQAVRSLALPSVYIFRPSILTGSRTEKRSGEGFGIAITKFVTPILKGPWKKYRAIAAEDVAKAMIIIAQKGLAGDFIFLSDQIQSISDGHAW